MQNEDKTNANGESDVQLDQEIDSAANESYNNDVGDDEANLELAMKTLRQRLKVCDKERREYLDGWQRSKADFINQRKSFDAERARMVARANEQLILDLIPVLDSFAMAMSNVDAWGRVDKEWRMGVEYIHSQILAALSGNGLSVIEPSVGTPFDPSNQTCVQKVSVTEAVEEHSVVSVLQKGYALGDKVIRPARVAVAFNENDGERDELTHKDVS